MVSETGFSLELFELSLKFNRTQSFSRVLFVKKLNKFDLEKIDRLIYYVLPNGRGNMMKKIFTLASILIFIFSGVLAQEGEVTEVKSDRLGKFKKYIKPNIRAFILTNQDYYGTNMDLKYVENDGQLYYKIFTKVLNVSPSKILWKKNLSRDEFYRAFHSFVNSIQKNELVFFIYSGHGRMDGTPVFTDLRSISRSQYRNLFDGFKNDTVFIMDSCHSGGMRSYGRGWGRPMRVTKGFRKNVLRIYSSLANQTSKESNYLNQYTFHKSFKKTKQFLRSLGYHKNGNGWFTLLYASFFAEYPFIGDRVSYNDLNSFINKKISDLEQDGFFSQRSNMAPSWSPFDDRKNFYLLYKPTSLNKIDRIGTNRKSLKATQKWLKSIYKIDFSISEMQEISELRFEYHQNYKVNDIRLLNNLRKLKSIYIKESEKKLKKAMKYIINLNQLTKLKLDVYGENGYLDDLLVGTEKLVNLEYLQIAALPTFPEGFIKLLTDRSLKRFSGLTRLKVLEISGTFTENGLYHLRGLKNLKKLQISGMFTNKGLSQLEDLTGLVEIDLIAVGQDNFTSEGFSFLKNMNKLTELKASANINISDKGLHHIRQLISLKKLNLSSTRVSDLGLKHFVRLKNLEVLDLSYTDVSDVGIVGLISLNNFKKLKYLGLNDTLVTKLGAEKLQKMLPKCRITYGKTELLTGEEGEGEGEAENEIAEEGE
ncbi:MAG: caspase family protein [Spirochaetota bacterium]|nr:caspase family protein [Spirochaetota bacterium]